MQFSHKFARYGALVTSFVSIAAALPVADIPASEVSFNSPLVLVDLNLSRDFGVDSTSIKPVLYELIEPAEDLTSALDSYQAAVEKNDIASAIVSILKLAAMKTDLEQLVEDITNDKVFYQKFVNDDLVLASAGESSNGKRDLTENSKEVQTILFNAFLSANATDSASLTLSKRSGWDSWNRDTHHSISVSSFNGLRDWLNGNSGVYSNGVTYDLCTGGNLRSCLTWNKYLGQLDLGVGGVWVGDAGPLWNDDNKYSAKTKEAFTYRQYSALICISDRIEGCK